LPAGQKITVPLAFKPSGIGVRTAQFVFQTDAPGGPQMVQLTGNGTALALAAPAGSSATVAAGQTATYNLVVTTGTTVSGTITMSCSGAPSGASCSPNPGSFSLGTVASQNVMVTVSTTPRSSASLLPLHPGLWWGLAGTLGIAFLRPRNRRPRRLLMMAGSLALLGTMLSCGGGGSGSGGGGNSGTPAGTYILSVSASGNSASNNLPLKLTVQ
jgi:hypothetical protein